MFTGEPDGLVFTETAFLVDLVDHLWPPGTSEAAWDFVRRAPR
jgi:hypothetical protein